MATAYLTRASLIDLIGESTLSKAQVQLGSNVDAVIAATCAYVDGYVLPKVSGSLTPEAIAQVAPIVAELVFATLNANSPNPEITKRKDAAMRSLRDIAKGDFVLHSLPKVDDPATPGDESDEGGPACGSERRRMNATRRRYSSWDD